MSLALVLLSVIPIAGFSPDAAHENRPELRARILQQQVRHQTRRLEEAIHWAQRLQHQLHQARAALEEPQPQPPTGGSGSPAAGSGSDDPGGSSWAATAACESGGDWQAGDGIGDDVTGGLQIATSTWLAYGGAAYASKAMYATPSQQIAIAERVLAGQGPGAWPNCPTP